MHVMISMGFRKESQKGLVGALGFPRFLPKATEWRLNTTMLLSNFTTNVNNLMKS